MDPAAALEDICARAIADNVTPGGVIALADEDTTRWVFPFGDTADKNDAGAAVRAATLYDLASLTKPMATAALVMQAVSAGRFDLEDPARNYLTALDREGGARDITIRHLVGHSAGLPPHVRFYEDLFARPPQNQSSAREALLELALEVGLEAAPGARASYSDVGYILLGALIEQAHGLSLDRLFLDHIAAPIGLASVSFAAPEPAAMIAPTERAADRSGELLRGVVHDENARAGGGVAGHAGLFGDAGDVLRFALAMATAARGEPNPLVDAGVAQRFVTGAAAPDTTWRLGWDTPSAPPARSHAGDLWPRDGFGHLGFTGTSMWIDPPRGRAVVILTNRVYRSRDPEPIRDFRRRVMDTIVAALP